MEENVIIKSKQYNPKKLISSLIIIGYLILLVASIYHEIEYLDALSNWRVHEHTDVCHYGYVSYRESGGYYATDYSDELVCAYSHRPYFCWEYFMYDGIIPFAYVRLLAFILKFLLSSYEMVVTDKRIYGKIVFGRRVDLPIDSISATGMIRILKGVSVSSASGKIKFLLIKNADQMYKEISNLLLNRQNKDTAIVTTSEE